MRRFIASILAGSAILVLSASPTLAVGLHQHYLTTPSDELVPIARGVCENDLQSAIDNLHVHVHLGAPTEAFSTNGIEFSAGSCPD
ncbi:MAG TPA: hypothetical protein VK831_03050 [Candidatus Deferrimicrobiaceae bacterium]|nr:hypothetical protein [Candidatus Deferrimicrobiaceae bacterium]